MLTPAKQQRAIKQAVRDRDGMRCVQCGMTNEQHVSTFGRSLHVHRLRPGSPYSVEGCVSLCCHCHPQAAKRKPGEPDVEHPGYRIPLPPQLYAQLAILAERNYRPINQQVRVIIEAALRYAGFWPPTDD